MARTIPKQHVLVQAFEKVTERVYTISKPGFLSMWHYDKIIRSDQVGAEAYLTIVFQPNPQLDFHVIVNGEEYVKSTKDDNATKRRLP